MSDDNDSDASPIIMDDAPPPAKDLHYDMAEQDAEEEEEEEDFNEDEEQGGGGGGFFLPQRNVKETGSRQDIPKMDHTSTTCFLFDVANITASVRRELAMPVSQFAVLLPEIMKHLLGSGGDGNSGTFFSAKAVDGVIDKRDEGAGAAKNLRRHFEKCGVSILEFSGKGTIGGASSQVQRAVDVSLAVELLEMAGVLVPVQPPTVSTAAAASSFSPKRHVVLFSSDADLEPAITAAFARNPNFRLTVVCDTRSTSSRYLTYLRQHNVTVTSLSSLLGVQQQQGGTASAAAAAAAAGVSTDDPSSPASPPPFSPLAGHSIIECRRKEYKSSDEWIAALDKALSGAAAAGAAAANSASDTAAAASVILKINNDIHLLDSDLAKLADYFAKATACVQLVSQLWIDHNPNILNSDKVGIETLSRLGAALGANLKELHASHTTLSASMCNHLSRLVIAAGRSLYLNANGTEAAQHEQAATRGFHVNQSNGKTVKLLAPAIGKGSVTIRFVGSYQQRFAQRQQQDGGGGRGRAGRGGRGRGANGRGRAFYSDSRAEIPRDQDFTADELLQGVEEKKQRGARGRGGGRGGRGQQQQQHNPHQQRSHDDDDGGDYPALRGRGGRGRGRGRGGNEASASEPTSFVYRGRGRSAGRGGRGRD